VEKLIRCPCGAVLRSTDEEALVADAQVHARDVHDMQLTPEQARDMIQPA
jgi:predicted small metal-binding protein